MTESDMAMKIQAQQKIHVKWNQVTRQTENNNYVVPNIDQSFTWEL